MFGCAERYEAYSVALLFLPASLSGFLSDRAEVKLPVQFFLLYRLEVLASFLFSTNELSKTNPF